MLQLCVRLPTQFEAEQLTGGRPITDLASALAACDELHARGPHTVIITSSTLTEDPDSITLVASTTLPQRGAAGEGEAEAGGAAKPHRLRMRVDRIRAYFTGTGAPQGSKRTIRGLRCFGHVCARWCGLIRSVNSGTRPSYASVRIFSRTLPKIMPHCVCARRPVCGAAAGVDAPPPGGPAHGCGEGGGRAAGGAWRHGAALRPGGAGGGAHRGGGGSMRHTAARSVGVCLEDCLLEMRSAAASKVPRSLVPASQLDRSGCNLPGRTHPFGRFSQLPEQAGCCRLPACRYCVLCMFWVIFSVARLLAWPDAAMHPCPPPLQVCAARELRLIPNQAKLLDPPVKYRCEVVEG